MLPSRMSRIQRDRRRRTIDPMYTSLDENGLTDKMKRQVGHDPAFLFRLSPHTLNEEWSLPAHSKRNAGIDGENEREREQVGVVTAVGAVMGAKFGF
ncbi:hypothetical protein NC653_025455 [Populus alba x Populus x berolinensis]|uniref:Uncharacterized protein n=1 Tax=Populus alba x Populus x berolinensis TaxID=444605 RepID=A0AAD6MBU4_9ROSI|nr:hypothetical protein NC653_025455 [Populus alba x Populus x berolinensis]